MNELDNANDITKLTSSIKIKTLEQTEYEINKPQLKILYKDDYLVAVDKPAGLFVHKSFMDKDEIYFALQLVRDLVGQYVYPVHRLDRPTSGVLLFALTKDVAQKMGELFSENGENKSIQKTYYALTRGHLLGEGLVDYALKEKLDKIGDKHANKDKPAQLAQTFYQSIRTASLPLPLGNYDTVRYSLIKLLPYTGRRHQIRRHLAHLRYPIIGDINYGDNKQNPFFIEYFGFKRLMLLAKELRFTHPITQEKLVITTSFDEQWLKVFERLGWQDLTSDS